MSRHNSGPGLALAAAILVGGLATVSQAAEAVRSAYKGWRSIALRNSLIDVQIVPEIGGRVIQLRLGDHEFLWVNAELAGKAPPPGGLGPDGSWLNYGGDKLWPAPQGWDNAEQWPGPPDGVLDGGPHEAAIETASGHNAAVALTSLPDKCTGIQFARTIRIHDGAARVTFSSTMKNVDSRPRRWSIWQVTQLDAGLPRLPAATAPAVPDYNPDLRFYSPLNPASVHPRGYVETFGLVNHPAFKTDYAKRMVIGQYRPLVGKIAADNAAGWIACVDGRSGYAFVERFTYFPEARYPGPGSVEFWLNGEGQIVAGGKVADLRDQPRYLEMEVLSPLMPMAPGDSHAFHLDWYAAQVGGAYPALDCTPVALTVEPFTARVSEGRLHLAGRFGVFYTGRADAVLLDSGEQECGRITLDAAVSPMRPLVVSAAEVCPPNAESVRVILSGSDGKPHGEVARAKIAR